MLYFSCDAQIDHVAKGLLDCTLPNHEWTHAAHFAAAFSLLRRRDVDAVREMPRLIRSYNEASGVRNTDTSGYHETITLASLRAARAWLAHRQQSALHEALNELLASHFGRSDWLLAYWSRAVLFSAEARRAWVDPDLKPLDF